MSQTALNESQNPAEATFREKNITSTNIVVASSKFAELGMLAGRSAALITAMTGAQTVEMGKPATSE